VPINGACARRPARPWVDSGPSPPARHRVLTIRRDARGGVAGQAQKETGPGVFPVVKATRWCSPPRQAWPRVAHAPGLFFFYPLEREPCGDGCPANGDRVQGLRAPGIAAATPRLAWSCPKGPRRRSSSRCAGWPGGRCNSSNEQPARRANHSGPTCWAATSPITHVGGFVAFGVDTGTPIINPGDVRDPRLRRDREMPWCDGARLVPRKVSARAGPEARTTGGRRQQGSAVFPGRTAGPLLLGRPGRGVTY